MATVTYLTKATNEVYSESAFSYISRSAVLNSINLTSAASGISAGAIAGAMAEESTAFGISDEALDKYAQSGIDATEAAISLIPVLNDPERLLLWLADNSLKLATTKRTHEQWRVDYEAVKNFTAKPSNTDKVFHPALIDAGKGNFKIATAIDIVLNYAAKPEYAILGLTGYLNDYEKLVSDLLEPAGELTAKLYGLYMKEYAEPFFTIPSERNNYEPAYAGQWESLPQTFRDALLVTYTNLGEAKIRELMKTPYEPQPALTTGGGMNHLLNAKAIGDAIGVDGYGDDVLGVETFAAIASQDNDAGLAARYALINLRYVALEGINYAVANSDGGLNLYNPTTGQGELTKRWITDRSAHLAWLLIANKEDTNLIRGSKHGYHNSRNWDFEDRATGRTISVKGQMLTDPASKVIFGGLIADSILGGTRGDRLYGMTGNDTIDGGDNADYIEGGTGNDLLMGGAGADSLIGGAGEDTLRGGLGNDTLEGGSGNDRYEITANQGVDVIRDRDGELWIADTRLTGGKLAIDGTTRTYLSEDKKIGFHFSGDPATSGTLLISGAFGSLRVENYHFGDLGIVLENQDDDVTLAPPETGEEIFGDREPIDQDPGQSGTQISYDENGNVITDPTKLVVDRQDLLYDSAGDDAIFAGGGNDQVTMKRGGHDFVDLGTGDDYVSVEDEHGNQGTAFISGGDGADTLSGGLGNDTIFGGAIVSTPDIVATKELEESNGETRDWIYGGSGGNDFLVGTSSSDVILGGLDNDTIIGGGGDDDLFADASGRVYIEWALTREVRAGSTPSIPATVYSHEQVNISGWNRNRGLATQNLLHGGKGDDWMFGGDGKDTLFGGDDNDVVFGHGGDDLVDGGEGKDTLNGGLGSDYLEGGKDDDELWGGDGNADGMVDTGADTLDGGIGNDKLRGEGGADLLFGGEGDDSIWGDYVNDERSPDLQGDDVLFGGHGNDVLFGNNGSDLLSGDEGADELHGGLGDDTLAGGAGNDSLYGDDGNDELVSSSGSDLMDGGAGKDVYTVQGLGRSTDLVTITDSGSDENDLIAIEDRKSLDIVSATLSSSDTTFTFSDGFRLKLTNATETSSPRFLLQDGIFVTQELIARLRPTPINNFGGETIGSAGNDTLGGTEYVYGGQGDDEIYISGNAKILLSSGAGIDLIAATQYGGEHIVRFLDDVRIEDLSIREFINEIGESAIGIKYGTNDELIVVDGWRGVISQYEFIDGSILTHEDILARLNERNLVGTHEPEYMAGGNSSDHLYGMGGDDTINGENGDDFIDGGAGDDIMEGGDGLDTYIMTYGMGNDTVTDSPAQVNQISIEDGVNLDDLSKSRDKNDIILHINDFDSLRIKDYYLRNSAWMLISQGQPVKEIDAINDHPQQTGSSGGQIEESMASEYWSGIKKSAPKDYLNQGYTATQSGILRRTSRSKFTNGTTISRSNIVLNYATPVTELQTSGTISLRTEQQQISRHTTQRQAIKPFRTDSGKGRFISLDSLKASGGLLQPGDRLAYSYDPITQEQIVIGIYRGGEPKPNDSIYTTTESTSNTTVNFLTVSLNGNEGAHFSYTGVGELRGTDWDDVIGPHGFGFSAEGTGVLLSGRGGNDILRGTIGNDYLTGGLGKNLLYGGSGADRYFVGKSSSGDLIVDGQSPYGFIDLYFDDYEWPQAAEPDVLTFGDGLLFDDLTLTWSNSVGRSAEGDDYSLAFSYLWDDVDYYYMNRIGFKYMDRWLVESAAPLNIGLAFPFFSKPELAALSPDYQIIQDGLGENYAQGLDKIRHLMASGHAIFREGVDEFVFADGLRLTAAEIKKYMPKTDGLVADVYLFPGEMIEFSFNYEFSISSADGQPLPDWLSIGSRHISGVIEDDFTGSFNLELGAFELSPYSYLPLVNGALTIRVLAPGVADSGTQLSDQITGTQREDSLAGGHGDDTLIGGAGADILEGGSGNDIVFGDDLRPGDAFASPEVLSLSPGSSSEEGRSDWIYGGSGNDILMGGVADDYLDGGHGEDMLYGGLGNDRLLGGADDDVYMFRRGDGADEILEYSSSPSFDRIVFHSDVTPDEVMISRSTTNLDDLLIRYGEGDLVTVVNAFKGPQFSIDHIEFQSAPGIAIDISSPQSPVRVDASNLLVGSNLSDEIVGSGTDDHIPGGSGSDSLRGNAGDDFLFGGSESMTALQLSSLVVRARGSSVGGVFPEMELWADDMRLLATTVSNQDFTDYLVSVPPHLSAARISIVFTNDAYRPELSEDRNLFVEGLIVNGTSILPTATGVVLDFGMGTDAFDFQRTQPGASVILTNGALHFDLIGADMLDGGSGIDKMYGGSGNDLYVVDDTNDLVVERENEGHDLVRSSVSYVLHANVEDLVLTGSGAIDGTGNAASNAIIGNSGNNVLTGGGGNDNLIGGGGHDYLDGGTGGDTMTGGLDNDVYIVDSAADIVTEGFNAGIDTVRSSVTYTLGENLEALILTGTAAINGTGNALNNTLIGNSGNNVLTGGGGWNYLEGGAGDDVLREGGTGGIVVGGDGSDVYVFSKSELFSGLGDYSSTTHNLVEGDQQDRLFLIDANPSEIAVERGELWQGWDDWYPTWVSGVATKDIRIYVRGIGTSDSGVILENYFNEDGTAGVNGLEGIQFADGTVWSLGDVREMLMQGGGENDVIYGFSVADNISGGSGNDYLDGLSGNDILTGGSGNDLLEGGAGSDTYRFSRGDGQDSIWESDTTVGNQDVVSFDSTVAYDQLWFKRVGNNLEVSVIGTTDKLTVSNWYVSSQWHVEQVAASDKILVDTQVQALVDAMASMTPPPLGQTALSASQASALQPVLASSWQ